jgi:hypothetical protein
MPAYDLPGSEKKVDGAGRPKIIIQNKMSSSKTIKVRMTIESEFTRQEVYDAIRSRWPDEAAPSEKRMDAIWARLSERSLGYTDISDAVWDEDEDDMCDKIKDALGLVISDEGLLEEEDEPPAEDEGRIALVKEFQQLMTERKIPEQEWVSGGHWREFSGETSEAYRKEVDETNGWETVYNAGHQTKGNPLGGERRENPRLPGQEGIFYQTYGNGGGAGGSGGYWAMRVSSGQHMPGVYEVAGQEFTLLEGVQLEFRPEHYWTGTEAAVRILPLTQERIADTLRQEALYQKAVAKREARRAAGAE